MKKTLILTAVLLAGLLSACDTKSTTVVNPATPKVEKNTTVVVPPAPPAEKKTETTTTTTTNPPPKP